MKKSSFQMMTLLLIFMISIKVSAQKNEIVDITKVTNTVNRTISMKSVSQKPVLHVNPSHGAGLIKIKHRDFQTGEIEFEVKGEDVFQKSFVGFAFHVQNDTTYEAIYFRPFNFRSDDELRKKHAVQYISLPGNDWPELRESFPLKYEQPIGQNTDPVDWFKVRIKVSPKMIAVYVNDSTKPCLEVASLGNLNKGKIAFWVGNNSGGDFRNLKISQD